jgi:hypothetical protein
MNSCGVLFLTSFFQETLDLLRQMFYNMDLERDLWILIPLFLRA